MPIGREARFIEIITIAKLPESYADFHFEGDSFNGPLLDERPADGFGLSPKLPGLGARVGRSKSAQSGNPAGCRAGTLLQPEGEILL
jgi:hypothetical protein